MGQVRTVKILIDWESKIAWNFEQYDPIIILEIQLSEF